MVVRYVGILLAAAGIFACSARAQIVAATPNLTADSGDTISYRFDASSGVITTQIGFLATPPVYGSLFGNGDVMSGGDYYLGEGFTSTSGYGATVDPVSAGTVIGSGSDWTAQARSSTATSTAYYGLRIAQGGGNYLYGWAEVALGQNGDGSTQLLAIAFERTLNQSIMAGATTSAVPEPASFAVLAGVIMAAFVGLPRRRSSV